VHGAANEGCDPHELAAAQDGGDRLATVAVQQKATDMPAPDEVRGLGWPLRVKEVLAALEGPAPRERNTC
jgi:hypothetical protein